MTHPCVRFRAWEGHPSSTRPAPLCGSSNSLTRRPATKALRFRFPTLHWQARRPTPPTPSVRLATAVDRPNPSPSRRREGLAQPSFPGRARPRADGAGLVWPCGDACLARNRGYSRVSRQRETVSDRHSPGSASLPQQSLPRRRDRCTTATPGIDAHDPSFPRREGIRITVMPTQGGDQGGGASPDTQPTHPPATPHRREHRGMGPGLGAERPRTHSIRRPLLVQGYPGAEAG